MTGIDMTESVTDNYVTLKFLPHGKIETESYRGHDISVGRRIADGIEGISNLAMEETRSRGRAEGGIDYRVDRNEGII